MGATTVEVAGLQRLFEAVALPVIEQPVEVGEGKVTFTQTAGGADRASGAPAGPTQAVHPMAGATGLVDTVPDTPCRWEVEFEVVGASKFPRHWVYDSEWRLAAKSGTHRFP